MMLYHYCCHHSAQLIARTMTLRPVAQPMLKGLPVVWATDQEIPDRDALGLTMHMVKCDRTEHRFTVLAEDEPLFTPWTASPLRALCRDLEAFEHPPLQPELWWVSINTARVTA